MGVGFWERISEVINSRIEKEDKLFELAFLRFGGARQWLLEQIGMNPNWMILDIGYGQGYLCIEAAFTLKLGNVIGVDHLHGTYTTGATQWIAKQVGVDKGRIALFSCDSTKLPFESETFDAVISFLALQDISVSRGSEGILATLDEASRVLRHGGVICVADDAFPSSRPKADQGRVFDSIRLHWRNLLPAERVLAKRLKKNGVSDVKVLKYDPKEKLPPKDAEKELRSSIEGARQLGVQVDFDSFWKKASEVIRREGRDYSTVVLLLGTKTKYE